MYWFAFTNNINYIQFKTWNLKVATLNILFYNNLKYNKLQFLIRGNIKCIYQLF